MKYFELAPFNLRRTAEIVAKIVRASPYAVANQQEPRSELARLTQKIEAVEQLMRDIG
jgi:hypothetical protein